eukprot:symbB.v1.2.011445.t1/scaffold762.1/size178242/6
MSSVPAAGESRTLYGLTLDPLRQVLYVSSPSQRVVLGFRLDTHTCTAPTISNAASPSCVEGTEIYGEHCTPQCLSGYAASVNTLYCAHGVLTPPSFSCQPAPCSAPWGIAHAAFPSCTEGDRIASGSTCTAECKSGVPDANLTCERGALQPTTFTCVLPTTVTVTVTGGSLVGDDGSTVTAAPVNSVVDGGSFTAVEILELEDSLFGAEVVFDPATAPRSDVALNGSFSFEAVTAGLTLEQVSILCGSNVLRQPLQEALVEVLALLPEDLQILALLPQLPSRRLAEAVAPTHRFSVVFTVATPPQWASLRFASLRLGTAKAQQEWLEALQKVHFLEAMVEISQNQQRPCSLPSAPAHAPQMLCQEAQVTTASEGICTTRCLEPFKPSEETLQCFAGFWSPSFFQCKESHRWTVRSISVRFSESALRAFPMLLRHPARDRRVAFRLEVFAALNAKWVIRQKPSWFALMGNCSPALSPVHHRSVLHPTSRVAQRQVVLKVTLSHMAGSARPAVCRD